MDKRFDQKAFEELINGQQPMNETFAKMAEQFSHTSQGRNNLNLAIFPMQDEGEDVDDYEVSHAERREVLQPSEFLQQSYFAKKIRQGTYAVAKPEEEETIESQLKVQADFDLNGILNSGRLMRLKLDMEKQSHSGLPLEEFVLTLKEVVQDQCSVDEETLISYLVDHFHRIDTRTTGKVTFDMLSSYMIEQELVSESNKEKALLYRPSNVADQSRHDNYIDKVFYYPSIDKVGVMEQNMRTLKIYNAKNLKLERPLFLKNGIALASEYVPEFNVFVLTSSDKTMQIINASSYAPMKRLTTPESQHTMFWSHKHQVLFTAGMEGKVYGWEMEKILTTDRKTEEVAYQRVLSKGMPWGGGKFIIFEIVELIKVNQLAAACDDKLIRIWDIRFEGSRTEPRNSFSGHTKAVRALAYSLRYNVLVSCGFEFDALVWNPYISEPICYLKGHESTLVSVDCPEINPTIITADAKGFIKVWNIADYSLLQTFYALSSSAGSLVASNNKLKAIKAVPKHRRLLAGSRKLEVFDYERPFVPELSDDSPICCAAYSCQHLQVFIAGQRAVKVWNAQTGRPVKLIGEFSDTEITAMTLDDTHRKVIVGDHSGRILMADSLSGVILKEFASHEGEVTGLCYVSGDKMLISSSWDKNIVIHDDGPRSKEKQAGIVRIIQNAHFADIICLAYSHSLDIIISAGRDCQVRVWDYETCALQAVLVGHKAEILVVKTLDPYPLLLVSDQSGSLSLWNLHARETKVQCLCKWRNMHTLEKTATITAATYWTEESELKLALGDEKGTVRVLDLTPILQETGIQTHYRENNGRNPKRIAQNILKPTRLEEQLLRQPSAESISSNLDTGRGDIQFRAHPIKEDHLIKQLAQWKAHKESIKFLEFVPDIVGCGLISAGLDNMARLWNTTGDCLGVLKQGARIKQQWDFQVSPIVAEKRLKRAREIIRNIKDKPRLPEFEESVISTLNQQVTDRSSNMISTLEMIKRLNEEDEGNPKEQENKKKKRRKNF